MTKIQTDIRDHYSGETKPRINIDISCVKQNDTEAQETDQCYTQSKHRNLVDQSINSLCITSLLGQIWLSYGYRVSITSVNMKQAALKQFFKTVGYKPSKSISIGTSSIKLESKELKLEKMIATLKCTDKCMQIVSLKKKFKAFHTAKLFIMTLGMISSVIGIPTLFQSDIDY